MKSGKISMLGVVAVLGGIAFMVGSLRFGKADLRWMLWDAPPEQSLTVAQGYFYPQANDLQCDPNTCRQAGGGANRMGRNPLSYTANPFPL